eukprot:7602860-Alexandrium_andersonii.AAC.1
MRTRTHAAKANADVRAGARARTLAHARARARARAHARAHARARGPRIIYPTPQTQLPMVWLVPKPARRQRPGSRL